jgi:hypothetical protein
MRKRFFTVFPLLSAIAIFVGLWIANRISIPAWQWELNQYLALKTSPPAAQPVAARTVQASQPWLFRADMSDISYGRCYYCTFAPTDVWCALVQPSTGDLEKPWVVYITYYQDLYNAGWFVHESLRSLSDPRLTDDLAAIGCSALLNPPP